MSHILSFMFIRSDLGYELKRDMEFTHHKERDNYIRIPLCVLPTQVFQPQLHALILQDQALTPLPPLIFDFFHIPILVLIKLCD